jgi:hypothetical protein
MAWDGLVGPLATTWERVKFPQFPQFPVRPICFFGMSEFRGSVLSIDQGELRGKKSRFLLNSLEKPNPGTQGPNAILSAVRDFSVTMES